MVYELVWKNQRLNSFTHACSGIDTHMHEKPHTLMHVNTHTNDSVAFTEYTSSPFLLFLFSREKVVVTICQRTQVFPFGSLHMQAYDIYYILISTHTHTHICPYTG